MKTVPGVPRDVVALFDHFAHQLAGAGFTRYSARAIRRTGMTETCKPNGWN